MTTLRSGAVLAVAALLLAILAAPGHTQVALQIDNFSVRQEPGFATLSWTAVAGVTEYLVERTPVDAQGLPTGAPVMAGVWRPNRQVSPDKPTFADAGFTPGGRYQWRVHAVPSVGGLPALPSNAVIAATLPQSGPSDFRTHFETTLGAQWTPHDAEIDWSNHIAAASERVRLVEIGRTAQGRAINLFVIGHPAPLESVEEISASPTAAFGCNVHGNEPSGREACFMMIRELAFSDEPWVVDILSHATVLVIPSLNGDGRAANTRGNMTGQDLNRDYGRLSQPETQAMVRFWRDYTPDVMSDHHEHGDAATCDVSLMNTPQLNNAEVTYKEARFGLIEGWMYGHAATDGWWPCPYPVAFSAGGQSFGNTSGLKHIIGMLVEARSSGGATRPDEAATENNTRRKAYSQLWTMRQVLDYHRANLPKIQQVREESIAFQTSNSSRVVFDGTYDWNPYPAPHPGERTPPNNQPGPGDLLENPPCGYLLTDAQYTTVLNDSSTLPAELRTTPAQRLAFHGIKVVPHERGHFVPMAQPLRGLIPLILDPQAEDLGIPIIVPAERLATCP